MRAHPNCNLDRLTELSFEFDQAGRIIDCIGTIKDGGNIRHDYAGSGLAHFYEAARRQLTGRQTTATILQFPNGERRPPHHAGQHDSRAAGPEGAAGAPLERGTLEHGRDNALTSFAISAEKRGQAPTVGEMKGGA